MRTMKVNDCISEELQKGETRQKIIISCEDKGYVAYCYIGRMVMRI